MPSNINLRLEEQVEAGSDSQVIRKYKLRAAQLVFITLMLGLPGIPLAGSIVPEDDLPLTFRAGMLTLISTVYLAIIWFWRASTIVHRDHIAVRQLFRTRRTAWPDVLSIAIDDHPASSRTMVLDREGRLFPLPGVDGNQALDAGLGVHGRAIKEIWERSRGGDWAPPTEAVVRAAKFRTWARQSAIVRAIYLTGGLFLALVASGLVLGARSGWDSDEIPWLFQTIGFVPVVMFTAVYQASVRLLRRRHACPDRG